MFPMTMGSLLLLLAHLVWSSHGRRVQNTNSQIAGASTPTAFISTGTTRSVPKHVTPTLQSFPQSFDRTGSMPRMSEDLHGSASHPQLGGVVLVTGSEEKPPFGGRAQIVFDIMSTVVRDPFSEVAPKFFKMPQSELEQVVNASAWLAFECGEIDEFQLQKTYFKDGRDFDIEGLKASLVEGYEVIDGMPELLQDLQDVGHKLHGFTDYPEWYALIEDKLGLEAKLGLQWTSVSCDTGLRSSEPAAWLSLLRRLGVRRKVGAAPVLFIDSDAEKHEHAEQLGISSVKFEDPVQLRKVLGNMLGSRKQGTAPSDGWPERVMR